MLVKCANGDIVELNLAQSIEVAGVDLFAYERRDRDDFDAKIEAKFWIEYRVNGGVHFHKMFGSESTVANLTAIKLCLVIKDLSDNKESSIGDWA